VARRGDGLAVGREGDAVDRPGVAGEGALLLALGERPQLDDVVEPGGGEQLAVGTEGDTVDEGHVALELGGKLHGGVLRRNKSACRTKSRRLVLSVIVRGMTNCKRNPR